jgi:mono/diheme cytochrome c family protein
LTVRPGKHYYSLILRLVLVLSASLTYAADLDRARELYAERCIACHAVDGGGGRGPSLLGRLKYGKNRRTLARIIGEGIPRTLMPSSDLPEADNLLLADYVRHLNARANPKEKK